jgi:hypothetical protein
MRRIAGCAGWLAVVAMVGCGAPDTVVVGEGLEGGAAGADDAASSAGRVIGFVLVDPKSSIDCWVLADGATINLSGPNFEGDSGTCTICCSEVTLRVQTEPAVVGSVVFAIDGKAVKTENHSLYAIAGNDLTTGLYNPWTLTVPATITAGTHVVEATPYRQRNGTSTQGNQPGISLQQTFQIQ